MIGYLQGVGYELGRHPAPRGHRPYGVGNGTASATGGTAVSLTWAAISGADRYQVDRKAASTSTWATVDQNVTTTSYAVSGLACGTAYGFRVSSHGDGKAHSGWSTSYATTTATTAACNSAPSFDGEGYFLAAREDVALAAVVGTVSATDPDGDTLTYSITSGNDAGRFALAASGNSVSITLAQPLDYETKKSYTLTLQVSDGKGGVATVTVYVRVLDVPEIGAGGKSSSIAGLPAFPGAGSRA